jgi:hypothetical protein
MCLPPLLEFLDGKLFRNLTIIYAIAIGKR